MKKRAKLTCAHLLTKEIIPWLEECFDFESVGCMAGKDELIKVLDGVSLLIMGGAEFIDEEIDDAYPNMKYIFIGIEAATSFAPSVWKKIVSEGRILVTGGGQEAVAQTTFLQLTFENPRRIQAEMVQNFMVPPSREEILGGQTLVVYGAGGIGARVLELCKEAFGQVFYTGRREKPELSARGFKFLPVPEAFEKADALSVHLELNPETEGIITADLLGLLTGQAFLLNNARAGLIPRNALAEFLFREARSQKMYTDRIPRKVMFDHYYVEGKQFTDLKKANGGSLRSIIKDFSPQFFEYTGHTAAFGRISQEEYSANLRQIIEAQKLA